MFFALSKAHKNFFCRGENLPLRRSLLQKKCDVLIQTVNSLGQICWVDKEYPTCGVRESVHEVNEDSMVSYHQ